MTGSDRIFGVFKQSKLENIENDKYFKDENSFVFSLNNNKIYKILRSQKAIRFNETKKIKIGNIGSSNGFYFGINNDIFDKGLLNYPKIYDFQKNSELTEGFNKLSELEIFELKS